MEYVIKNREPKFPWQYFEEISAVPRGSHNEAAVAAFLQDRIGFYQITDVVQECMEGADFVADPDLDTIFATNGQTLAKAQELIKKISRN